MTTVPAQRTSWPITPDGVWLDLRRDPASPARAGLFLDRDGVIVEDTGFLTDPEAVTLVPGAAALIAAANRQGIPVAVATNQSGIDRGVLDWRAFAAVERRIERLLGAQGAAIDALAACPFHPDFTAGYGPAHARWRKPGAAMITALAGALNLDTGRSWLVGDRRRDIAAAAGAGLAGAVLVGRTADHAAATDFGRPGFAPLDAADVSQAADLLQARLLRPSSQQDVDGSCLI